MNTLIKTIFQSASALLILTASAGPARADYEAGREAANRGDFARALREWMPLALAGDTNAQYGLGRMYARGDGVPRDFKEARHWFSLAAERGHAKAASKLGTMYEYGDGIPKDEREAAHWYSVAAKAGDLQRLVYYLDPQNAVGTDGPDGIKTPPLGAIARQDRW